MIWKSEAYGKSCVRMMQMIDKGEPYMHASDNIEKIQEEKDGIQGKSADRR